MNKKNDTIVENNSLNDHPNKPRIPWKAPSSFLEE